MEIRIENLSKSFDNIKVLDNINMVINREKPVCIMGTSGRGKTTLMNIVLGITQPDSGKVITTENITYSAVFQEDRLCSELSAVMNIAIVTDNPDRNKIEKDLLSAGFSKEEILRPVSTLSGGQKRRVAILRRLESHSKAIFMDEPFKGLDEETRRQVIQLVKEKTRGRILAIITHDEKDAMDLQAEIINL